MIDQGVVSLGTFLFNILLARNIPLNQYGLFAMLFGVVSLMQAISASLIFYPLSVQYAAAAEAVRKRLIRAGLVMTAALVVPLALLLAVITDAFIDPRLVLSALAFFVAAQIQEALRRSLLAQFRHRDAVLGDTISYLGQAVALAALAAHGTLDLAVALFTMAATSLLAAAVQLAQVGIGWSRSLSLRATARDFWSIGRWSLWSNVLAIGRVQILPWLLAATSGAAAAGAFQACLNILNVTNPVVMAISNIIPQAAARRLAAGYRAAWDAAWPYIRFGIPIVLAFSAALVFLPETLIRLVYGSEARQLQIVSAIQVLACASFVHYCAAVGCAYLHGVDGGRDGLLADLAATAVVLTVAFPLTTTFGLAGSCSALALSHVVRMVVLYRSILLLLASPTEPAAASLSWIFMRRRA